MIKVLKYLKYSIMSVVVIIALLCVQAVIDLELPNYTSKIVNVGIQQGGIENASPEVIRQREMEKILLFTSEDEKIINSYTLITEENKDNSEYKKYLKKFPEIENESIYVINKLSEEEKNELNNTISKPLMILSQLQNEEIVSGIKQSMISENMPEEAKQAILQSDLIDLITVMPEEQLATSLEQMNSNIDEMSESIVEQAAISYVKTEYQAMGIDTNKIQNNYILFAGLQMLGISLISMFAGVGTMFLGSRVAAKLGKTLREKVFKKVLKFSNAEFTKFGAASLITRSTNDIGQIQNLMPMLFRIVIYAPIIGVGGFLKVLSTSDNSMAWVIGVAILAILFIVANLFIFAMPKFKKLQILIDKVNLVAREILTGLPVIRAFNREKHEEERFSVASANLSKTNRFVNRAMSFMMPSLMFVMNGITVLIVWVGGHNVDTGIMQVGDLMAFIQYTMQIVMAFLMISMISIMLPRASVSAGRISEVLDTKESIKDPKNPKTLSGNRKGLVEFKNVSFKYPDADEETLLNISFIADPGTTTAIIGSTGSGKSTVVNLIPRFYDVTDGEVLIDGINVKDVSQEELRKRIGFIPQKGVLFSGTIESNIKYGNSKISDKKMKEAADIAQAMNFIEEKDNKYNSEISQGGTNVSGGQKQRLSIARAIAIDPEVFVFDDSFSALDYKTDVNLRTALAEKTNNKTVIIVAQRISTVLHADQIIVLEEGKIVGKGTHEELMKTCETYQQIATSQLSREELE